MGKYVAVLLCVLIVGCSKSQNTSTNQAKIQNKSKSFDASTPIEYGDYEKDLVLEQGGALLEEPTLKLLQKKTKHKSLNQQAVFNPEQESVYESERSVPLKRTFFVPDEDVSYVVTGIAEPLLSKDKTSVSLKRVPDLTYQSSPTFWSKQILFLLPEALDQLRVKQGKLVLPMLVWVKKPGVTFEGHKLETQERIWKTFLAAKVCVSDKSGACDDSQARFLKLEGAASEKAGESSRYFPILEVDPGKISQWVSQRKYIKVMFKGVKGYVDGNTIEQGLFDPLLKGGDSEGELAKQINALVGGNGSLKPHPTTQDPLPDFAQKEQMSEKFMTRIPKAAALGDFVRGAFQALSINELLVEHSKKNAKLKKIQAFVALGHKHRLSLPHGFVDGETVSHPLLFVRHTDKGGFTIFGNELLGEELPLLTEYTSLVTMGEKLQKKDVGRRLSSKLVPKVQLYLEGKGFVVKQRDDTLFVELSKTAQLSVRVELYEEKTADEAADKSAYSVLGHRLYKYVPLDDRERTSSPHENRYFYQWPSEEDAVKHLKAFEKRFPLKWEGGGDEGAEPEFNPSYSDSTGEFYIPAHGFGQRSSWRYDGAEVLNRKAFWESKGLAVYSKPYILKATVLEKHVKSE